MIIASVCKSGGVYGQKHVETLQSMVSRHLTAPFEFVCLTDKPFEHPQIQCLKLQHAWPGWFSKIELFGPLLEPFQRVLYFDLDMVITGNLSEIAAVAEPFIIAGDVYRRPPRRPKIGYQSSTMSFVSGAWSFVYETFAANAARIISGFHSDQEFLETQIKRATFWENIVPGQICSYKVHCQGQLPPKARVVDFHGKHKPWQLNSWVKQHYR